MMFMIALSGLRKLTMVTVWSEGLTQRRSEGEATQHVSAACEAASKVAGVLVTDGVAVAALHTCRSTSDALRYR